MKVIEISFSWVHGWYVASFGRQEAAIHSFIQALPFFGFHDNGECGVIGRRALFAPHVSTKVSGNVHSTRHNGIAQQILVADKVRK